MEKELIDLSKKDAGTLAVVTREQTEIQARVFSAKKFPRDEEKAYSRLMNSMTRLTMAESAEYSFPRGGKAVTGPSVDLAREGARCWGNIHYGLRIVSSTDQKIHIRGFAVDLETNTYAEAEDEFKPLIQRKIPGTKETEWRTPDERDLRELINRRGAICVRNALLQILPPDIIEDARKRANETLQQAADGSLSANREDTIRRMVLNFDKIGVSKEMLEEYLTHPLSLITGEELSELKRIWKSINDGQTKREEHFVFPISESEKVSIKDRVVAKAATIKKDEQAAA